MKARSTIACIVLAVALLGGCTTTYSYRLKFAGNPRRAEAEACWARCKRSRNPACLRACPGTQEAEGSCPDITTRSTPDCAYWSQLLAYQPDEAGRQRLLGSMPLECAPVELRMSAAPPALAPVCRSEQRVSGGKVLMTSIGIGLGLYLGLSLALEAAFKDVGNQGD